MNGQPQSTPYRVLARKYRPSGFDELIGQDAMVRTLRNAIASGRLAHAFILTGVRGVGKTTTARIIARALNCTGGEVDGPTAEPCGTCENCISIAEDRHVDVIEMDAASRTGVGDMRELIEGTIYRPVSARYKVYIVDEVHMLSTSAFNALLKTLEEPPGHVKFVFATTETRKVPVTVLSRCQRFDLRRVDAETLVAHYSEIAAKEGVEITDDALGLIARAADGSVRDGLSLLDQAIAHAAGAKIEAAEVSDMLGLVDRLQILDLFEALMSGDISGAMARADVMYASGADPVVILQDLLELSHWLTRLKAVPDGTAGTTVSDVERTRGRDIADRLAMPELTRAWQMLLKGLNETRTAPSPIQALEMVLVRLAYAAELPSPADMVRTLQSGQSGTEPGRPQAAPAPNPSAPAPAPEAPPAMPQSFDAVVELFGARREALLRTHLRNHVHLVSFAPGKIVVTTTPEAPGNLATTVAKLLGEWTGSPWTIEISAEDPPEPTLRAQADETAREDREDAISDPVVQAALEAFPGSQVEDVRHVEPAPAFDGEALGPDPNNGDEAI
jgi:DNA polymerase-3 subunit gamma/tau